MTGMEVDARHSILDLVYGVLAKPEETLRYVTGHRLWAWGISVYVVVALANSLLAFSALEGLRDLTFDSQAYTVSAGAFFASTFLPSLVFLFVLAGFVHLITRALGGQGSFTGVLAGLGFAYLPMIIMAPLLLLARYGGIVGSIFYYPASFGIFIWWVILAILGIKENYSSSPGQATAGCLLSGCASVIVVGIIGVIIVVLVVVLSGL